VKSVTHRSRRFPLLLEGAAHRDISREWNVSKEEPLSSCKKSLKRGTSVKLQKKSQKRNLCQVTKEEPLSSKVTVGSYRALEGAGRGPRVNGRRKQLLSSVLGTDAPARARFWPWLDSGLDLILALA